MALKRRELFTAGIAAATVAALPRRTAAASAPGTELRVGDFILRQSPIGLAVAHSRNPNRVIWSTDPSGNFLAAEDATSAIKEVGSPEGTFIIADAVKTRYERPAITSVNATGNKATASGELTGSGGKINFAITFGAVSPTHLRFVVDFNGANAGKINRTLLAVESTQDEAIFGLGCQLTYFNQKGLVVPILVQEHGIGRGRPGLTQIVDIMDHDSGGNPYHTGIPAPYILTSRMRSMFLENYEYSVFDMREAEATRIKLWSNKLVGRILYGETPLQLLEAFTEYSGRMRKLPDWVHDGVILGIMGGTAKVRARIAKTQGAGVPIAGLWLQDWEGTHTTTAGTQLWWNWFLDKTYYPDWRGLVEDIAKMGGKILTYINPFLAREPGHDQLFQEAQAKGYLVLQADGSPYLIRNANFLVGMLDLSNPGTRSWIKGIMKTNMLGTGAGGWMNDFAEALPFDSKLYQGADPAVWHNRYPEEWQRVNREAIDESEQSENLLFFSRSGYTKSPGIATLFWLGDQLMTWDQYDGIKTAVVGLLSGGISGFSLMHTDVGGYVALKFDHDGKEIPVINRTPELMMRWMELNAFTPVMRTQEGITPQLSIQADSNQEMLAHLARFGRVYRALGPYRKALETEANTRGTPLVRHPFIHYPDDPNTYQIRYQFMLGRDLLIAPVVDRGKTTVDVYFPRREDWSNAWTGENAGRPGEWVTVPAPIGQPAVFVRKGSPNEAAIMKALREANPPSKISI